MRIIILITLSLIFLTLGVTYQGGKVPLNSEEEEVLKELLKIEIIVFKDSTQNYLKIYKSRNDRIIVTLRYYDEVYTFLIEKEKYYLLSIRYYKDSSFRCRKKNKKNRNNMLFDLKQIAEIE